MTANIRHSSESNEFYTPAYIVEPARYVLGGFDCDPASSAFANELIRATVYYTEEQNGLLVPGGWRGHVLLNPPGGLVDNVGHVVHRSSKGNVGGCTVTGSCGLPAGTVERIYIGGVPHDKVTPGHKHEGVTSSAVTWWRALCGEWEAGRVTAAIFIGFSIELLQSCQGGPNPGHHPLDFPCCFPKDRIPFDVVKNLPTTQCLSCGGGDYHTGLGGCEACFMNGKEHKFPVPEFKPTRVTGKQPTHSNVIVLLPATAVRENVTVGGSQMTWTGDDVQMIARFEEAFTPVGYIHRGNGMHA